MPQKNSAQTKVIRKRTKREKVKIEPLCLSYPLGDFSSPAPLSEELKVSTMTCLCNLNVDIDLSVISRFVPVYAPTHPYIMGDKGGCVYVEHCTLLPRGDYCGRKNKKKKTKCLDNTKKLIKASKEKYKPPPKPVKRKKQFDNQSTFLMGFKANRFVNIKIFNNGELQMTGIKSFTEAEWIVNRLIEIIKETKVKYYSWDKIKNDPSYQVHNQYVATKEKKIYRYVKVNEAKNTYNWLEVADSHLRELRKNVPAVKLENQKDMKMSNFKTVLINSYYRYDFYLDRAKLHKLLDQKYHIYSFFDPNNYQGVKSYFYWKQQGKSAPNPNDKSNKQNGICYCDPHCFIRRKQNKKKPTPCVGVTIANFRTGSIIITGAQTIEQVMTTYHFINNLIAKHLNEIIIRKDVQKNKKSIDQSDLSKLSDCDKIRLMLRNRLAKPIKIKKASANVVSKKPKKKKLNKKPKYFDVIDIVNSPYKPIQASTVVRSD